MNKILMIVRIMDVKTMVSVLMASEPSHVSVLLDSLADCVKMILTSVSATPAVMDPRVLMASTPTRVSVILDTLENNVRPRSTRVTPTRVTMEPSVLINLSSHHSSVSVLPDSLANSAKLVSSENYFKTKHLS